MWIKVYYYYYYLGTSILKVEATDADNGENAVIEYFIIRGAYDDFKIDNTTGVLYVAQKLDYDRRNTYNIEVVAVDHGEPSLTGTSNVTVTVININDKMPYFVPATQKVEVRFKIWLLFYGYYISTIKELYIK